MRNFLKANGKKVYGSKTMEKWRLNDGRCFAVTAHKKGEEYLILGCDGATLLYTQDQDKVKKFFGIDPCNVMKPYGAHEWKKGVSGNPHKERLDDRFN